MQYWARLGWLSLAVMCSACPVDPTLDASQLDDAGVDATGVGTHIDAGANDAASSGSTKNSSSRSFDAGGVCPAGTAGADCAPCPAGSYCPGGGVPMALCATNQYDDDQSPSTPCVAASSCDPGSYVAVAYSRVTNQRCAPCPNGTFSTTTNARSCEPWVRCDSGQYEAAVPDATHDRACAQYVACGPNEFIAETGSSTQDHACNPTTVCQPGEYEAEAPSQDRDRRCMSCPFGSYSTTENAQRCVSWTACSAPLYEAVPGSSTSDRVCAAESDCLPGEYRHGSSEQDKQACRPCPSGFYSTHANARSCTAWSRCKAGDYERDAPQATRDRMCATPTTCHPGQYVATAPSGTQDRKCAACPTGFYSDNANAGACLPWTECAANEREQVAPSAARDRSCQPQHGSRGDDAQPGTDSPADASDEDGGAG